MIREEADPDDIPAYPLVPIIINSKADGDPQTALTVLLSSINYLRAKENFGHCLPSGLSNNHCNSPCSLKQQCLPTEIFRELRIAVYY